jgi:hypothetical protein
MLKNLLKQQILALFRQVIVKDTVKAVLVDSLNNPFLRRSEIADVFVNLSEQSPYPELTVTSQTDQTTDRADIIFITGRFRSGSTLLWNIFRAIHGTTAYYEPFNENQWFDPYVPRKRGVDKTHKLVDNYDKEYQGLEVLSEFYREDWIRKNLYMNDFFYAPIMKQFISILIEHAPGMPVLQFNRIDFRLPWIRQNFPNAKLIHIYRHPRDQWCSTLLDNLSSFPPDGTMNQFIPYDGFYLRLWAEDLKYQFPFLDECLAAHPYELFYYIWKLSFLFGRTYAHCSICFEALVEQPTKILSSLFEQLDIDRDNISRVEDLIIKPKFGKWKQYAEDRWFSEIESRCESIIQDFWESQQNRR